MKALIEMPDASRAWLQSLPQDCQSWASNFFLGAIREGKTTPREVCRMVAECVRERHAQAEAEGDAQGAAKLARIWRNLIDCPQLAMAFAVERLQWETLTPEQKARHKAENAERYRAEWREGHGQQSGGRRP